MLQSNTFSSLQTDSKLTNGLMENHMAERGRGTDIWRIRAREAFEIVGSI